MKATKYLHCNVRKIVQPFFENVDDDASPTGVELIEALDPIDLDDHLRYTTRPNISEWSWSDLLSLQELDLIVEHLHCHHQQFDDFSLALLAKIG